MLMVAYRAHPAVATALKLASAEIERTEEIAVSCRATQDLEAFRRDAEMATVAVLDMRTLTLQELLDESVTTLQQHPFIRLTIVTTALSNAEDQRKLFDLGRMGVSALALTHEAEASAWWAQYVTTNLHFDVVQAAHRELHELLAGSGAYGELVLRVAQYATVPSIKILAERIYTDDRQSNAYKRRLLWEECKRVRAGTPEDVLAAVRLVLLKSILDADQWTTSRIARHFGMDTPRNLNRSCKNRYGLSVRDIRQLSKPDVHAKASSVFREHAPWQIAAAPS